MRSNLQNSYNKPKKEAYMLKIYLAGPDVFEKDAVQQGKELKRLCYQYGFEGLFPLDNEIKTEGTPYEVAKAIRDANIRLIHDADIILANLNPFRGLEPDSGTIYEVGYATALGKKVYAYAEDRRPMIERIIEAQGLSSDATFCKEGKVMEDFGLSHNLMMLDIPLLESAQACLQLIKTSR